MASESTEVVNEEHTEPGVTQVDHSDVNLQNDTNDPEVDDNINKSDLKKPVEYANSDDEGKDKIQGDNAETFEDSSEKNEESNCEGGQGDAPLTASKSHSTQNEPPDQLCNGSHSMTEDAVQKDSESDTNSHGSGSQDKVENHREPVTEPGEEVVPCGGNQVQNEAELCEPNKAQENYSDNHTKDTEVLDNESFKTSQVCETEQVHVDHTCNHENTECQEGSPNPVEENNVHKTEVPMNCVESDSSQGSASGYVDSNMSNGDVSQQTEDSTSSSTDSSPGHQMPESHSSESQISSGGHCSSTMSSATPSPSHSMSSELSLPSPTKMTSSGDSASVTTDQSEDQLLSELDAELDNDQVNMVAPNGLRSSLGADALAEYKQLKLLYDRLQKDHLMQKEEIKRYKEDVLKQKSELTSLERERDLYKRRHDDRPDKSTEDIYILQIKELEVSIAKLQREVKVTKDKLASHDAAAKRAVGSLQNELQSQMEKAKKQYDECKSDKEMMVMKYAQAEQKNIELQDKMYKMEERMREMTKEREAIIAKFKTLKYEKDKAAAAYETRHGEILAMKKEMEKQKEAISSVEVKAKWHQNKLKVELDNHKETKQKLEDYMRKLKEAKEETSQIRQDCQAMIRTYQESEEIKSNSLDAKLKEKMEELQLHQQEHSDQEEVHKMTKVELESLKRKHKEMLEEDRVLKDKVSCLEAERIVQEDTLTKFKATLQKQKKDISKLREHLAILEETETKFEESEKRASSLEDQVKELEDSNKDLSRDIEGCSSREMEHLTFTQKISDKNAALQSENSSLHSKVENLTKECQNLETKCKKLEEQCAKLRDDLTEERRLRVEETGQLSTKLAEKSKAVDQLSVQVEEGKDEIKTLKRRHQANIKDLTRQLQQARRKLEGLENKGDGTSMGSRTSSNGSLDTQGPPGGSAAAAAQDASAANPEPVHVIHMEDQPPIVEVVEVDRQKLLEKIVKIQKSHARKSEKIDFLQEHVKQLVEELQKKNRLIQAYILREEAGTLAPETADQNKAEMARKAGIMASLYSSQARDGHMTLDLSLQINAKLQAVLEDTILKNITLKENLETLGGEIARLSQENRSIKMSMGKS